jgi:hypothetical protein
MGKHENLQILRFSRQIATWVKVFRFLLEIVPVTLACLAAAALVVTSLAAESPLFVVSLPLIGLVAASLVLWCLLVEFSLLGLRFAQHVCLGLAALVRDGKLPAGSPGAAFVAKNAGPKPPPLKPLKPARS